MGKDGDGPEDDPWFGILYRLGVEHIQNLQFMISIVRVFFKDHTHIPGDREAAFNFERLENP